MRNLTVPLKGLLCPGCRGGGVGVGQPQGVEPSAVHQAGTTAELTVKLLLTQTVRLDHLTEHLISVVTGGVDQTRPTDQTVTVLTSDTCGPGTTAAQTVVLTPVTHVMSAPCCRSRVMTWTTGLDTTPVLLKETLGTFQTLLLTRTCTRPTG